LTTEGVGWISGRCADLRSSRESTGGRFAVARPSLGSNPLGRQSASKPSWRQLDVPEVDLALVRRRRLEPNERFFVPGSDRADVLLELRVATRVPRGPDLFEQPNRRSSGRQEVSDLQPPLQGVGNAIESSQLNRPSVKQELGTSLAAPWPVGWSS
jgi:hypothetical protein